MQCCWEAVTKKCNCNVQCELRPFLEDGIETHYRIGKCPNCGISCTGCVEWDKLTEKDQKRSNL